MIYKALLWYALLQGVKKWLKGELPKKDLKWIDRILMEYYVKPIREQLNMSLSHKRILMGLEP